MKKGKVLAILAAAAVVVVLGAIILPRLDWGPAQPEPTSGQGVVLSNKRTADVASTTITTADFTRTFTLNDRGEWVIEGMDDFTVNQELASTIAYNAAYVKGEAVVAESLDNKEIYGLDEPQITVHTVFTDGTDMTFYIGDQTPSRSTYYAYREGDNRIVTLWSSYYTALTYTLDDLQSFDLLNLLATTVTRIRVERPGEPTMEFVKRASEDNVSLLIWWVVQPWEHQCDTSALRPILDTLVYIEPEEVADSQPENLSKYGLTQPHMTLTMENEDGQVYTLYFGDKPDSFTYYFMIEGDPRVYTTTSSRVDAIDVTPFSMTDKNLSLLSIEKVKQITFDGLGQYAQIQVRQIDRLDENGEVMLNTEGNPIQDSEFTLDGKITNMRAGETWYETCLAVRLHSVLTEEFTPRGQEPAVSLVYDLNHAGISRYTFNFYEYGKDFYAVEINGDINFLVRREEVQRIADKLVEYRNGDLDA